MLIISSYRDYYDKIKAFGIDKTVVYKRETVEFPTKRRAGYSYHLERDDFPYDDERQNQKSKYVFKYAVIGFCGQLYPVVQALRSDFNGTLLNKTNFYSYDELADFLSQRHVESKGYGYYRETDIEINSPTGLKYFFDTKNWSKLLVKFQEHKTPVFAYVSMKTPSEFKNEGLRLNPPLQDYDFGKVKDAVTAFQSIYMYISGVLGVEARPMVKISDKDLAKKRGHDGKYSFRTPPKTRKK